VNLKYCILADKNRENPVNPNKSKENTRKMKLSIDYLAKIVYYYTKGC